MPACSWDITCSLPHPLLTLTSLTRILRLRRIQLPTCLEKLPFSGWQRSRLKEPHAIPGTTGLVAQSCPTLCDPVACSPPGSSVHGILQARILERAVNLFSRRSSWPRDQNCISFVSCIVGGIFTSLSHQGQLVPMWEILASFTLTSGFPGQREAVRIYLLLILECQEMLKS